jgi:hypothetical protein
MNRHVKEQNGPNGPFCIRFNHYDLFLEENLDHFQCFLFPGHTVGHAGGL